MKVDKFMHLRKNLNKDCEIILKGKGESYSGKKDKLGNFKRVAKALGMRPEQVWLVYFLKHVDAISSFIRGEYNDTEPIEGRIIDVRNYADLLYGIIKEK